MTSNAAVAKTHLKEIVKDVRTRPPYMRTSSPAAYATKVAAVAAKAERDQLAARLAEAQERLGHFETLAAEAREDAKMLADSIRAIEEVAGLSPQMAMCEIGEELRGERLREVALEVLQRLWASGDPVHYRIWFEALVEAGFRVSGRDPLATFLTQITRIDKVESVGRRSGLYRLRIAA